MTHEETIKRIQELTGGTALEKGVEVFVNSDFGIQGYGNVQCVQTYTPENGEVSLYGHNENGKSYNIKTILGKPITLSVVFMAVRQSQSVWLGFKLRETQVLILEDWNLSKDNFNDQSEETKSFIGGLLTNNSKEK